MWIGALIAIPALPFALGLSIQQQFSPLATHVWKDRVWDHVGPEISQCIAREVVGNGDFIIQAARADDPQPAGTSAIPYVLGIDRTDIESQNLGPDFDTRGLQN